MSYVFQRSSRPDRSLTAQHEDAPGMIKLTRLDGEPFILNADLIRYVEARPDTFITLTTGERVVVAETMDEVLLRAVTYQQVKHLIPSPTAPHAPRAGGTEQQT
jgi:flagellar protein FlbD